MPTSNEQEPVLHRLRPLGSMLVALAGALGSLGCGSSNDAGLYGPSSTVSTGPIEPPEGPGATGNRLPPPVGTSPGEGSPNERNVDLPLGAMAPGVGGRQGGGNDAGADVSDADAGGLIATIDCLGGPFQRPERVSGLGSNLELRAPALSADALTLYLAAAENGGPEHLFYATRTERGNAFSSLIPLGGVNSEAAEGSPVPSSDGLTLYFYSTREGGLGDRDLWSATRANATAEFANPTLLANVNTPAVEHLPWVTSDGLALFFVSTRAEGAGGSDVWAATRATRAEEFTMSGPLSSLNTVADQGRAVLTTDLLTLVFAAAEADGVGSQELWIETRQALDAPLSAASARNFSELNGPGLDIDPFVSGDGLEIFFSSDRGGRSEIWRSVRGCE